MDISGSVFRVRCPGSGVLSSLLCSPKAAVTRGGGRKPRVNPWGASPCGVRAVLVFRWTSGWSTWRVMDYVSLGAPWQSGSFASPPGALRRGSPAETWAPEGTGLSTAVGGGCGVAQEPGAEKRQASWAARAPLTARAPALRPRSWGSPQWQSGRLPTLGAGAPAASAICSQRGATDQGSEASGHPSTTCTSLAAKATASHG